MMTREDWVDWKNHPITQIFIDHLIENRGGRKEEIAEGKVVGNELYLEIGRCQGLKDAIDYALRYFHIEEDNADSSGVLQDFSQS